MRFFSVEIPLNDWQLYYSRGLSRRGFRRAKIKLYFAASAKLLVHIFFFARMSTETF